MQPNIRFDLYLVFHITFYNPKPNGKRLTINIKKSNPFILTQILYQIVINIMLYTEVYLHNYKNYVKAGKCGRFHRFNLKSCNIHMQPNWHNYLFHVRKIIINVH